MAFGAVESIDIAFVRRVAYCGSDAVDGGCYSFCGAAFRLVVARTCDAIDVAVIRLVATKPTGPIHGACRIVGTDASERAVV